MNTAIILGHIWTDGKTYRGRDIEILKIIHNDKKGTDIFDDVEDALLDEIDIGDSKDYYFIAVVHSKFVERVSWEGIEYDVDHYVKEVKSVKDLITKEEKYIESFDFIDPRPPMKLDGGIDTYSFEGKRYVTDVPPLGRKVFYLDRNGYEIQRETANQYFKKGQILTIKEIYVGSSNSKVEFIEVPNKRFNTVMFADLN